MNWKPVKLALAIVLPASLGSLIGPVIAERVTPSDALVWQLFPWLLIAAIWIGLIAWIRRARSTP